MVETNDMSVVEKLLMVVPLLIVGAIVFALFLMMIYPEEAQNILINLLP